MTFDLVLTYKILHGLVDVDISDFFAYPQSGIRGHDLKLYKSFCKHDYSKYFFANRVVDVWNSLPNPVVTASSLVAFKGLINKIDFSKFLKGRGLDV